MDDQKGDITPDRIQYGQKDDIGKTRYDLVPWTAVEEMVKVLTFGAKKYDPDNWRYVPDAHDRYFAAALRHLVAYKRGEEKDKETNLSHLAHAMCCVAFILELDKEEEDNFWTIAEAEKFAKKKEAERKGNPEKTKTPLQKAKEDYEEKKGTKGWLFDLPKGYPHE